jgi:hypothetical protein
MLEEGADALGGLRREYVLELAGLLFDLSFAFDVQGLSEEPFGQAVAANDLSGALAPTLGEVYGEAAVLWQRS